jgi:5-methylcytosine-specific restriction endonuclease McrA
MSKIRGICATPGCNNIQGVINYNKNTTGVPNYRPWCYSCHSKRTAAKHGLEHMGQVVAKNAGYDSTYDYNNAMAIKANYPSATARKNAKHPYLKFRKTYCENIDGRLGQICTYPITVSGQLQVDHIDGNPTNNDLANLQTLCANCHILKTDKNKDWQTRGRKSYKQAHVTTFESLFGQLETVC